MSVVPGTLETDRQPPMVVPLRHFVVGLGFLVLGGLAGLGVVSDSTPPLVGLVHVHLLLAGWVCITIMGAMTQFVPVWSGVRLHSRRLATVQLWLVAAGLLGFAGSLATASLTWSPVFGGVALLGFWTFVYNVGRTLSSLPSYDVTERHFALGLGFFVLVTALGFLLAVDFVHPVFAPLSVPRGRVARAHATVAVFGAVLTTVLGALYQLGTMFTQTELHGIDVPLRRLEEAGYPIGVSLLAGGRLLDSTPLGRVGGVLVAVSLLGFGAILGRRLWETRVEWTPMLSRYAVVVAALASWSALALVAWLRNPLDDDVVFGAPGTAHLLVLGVVGFVVLGTLYHVVPFVVWVHRYSDLLGYEPVPMIDDLYDDRIAAVDFILLLGGTSLLVAGDASLLPAPTTALGGVLVLAGTLLFSANVLWVVRQHSRYSVLGLLSGRFVARTDRSSPPADESTGSE